MTSVCLFDVFFNFFYCRRLDGAKKDSVGSGSEAEPKKNHVHNKLVLNIEVDIKTSQSLTRKKRHSQGMLTSWFWCHL